MSDRMMVSILGTSLRHLWTVFDRRETHLTHQTDARRIDTIILPFFKDPFSTTVVAANLIAFFFYSNR
jgi:hypothetical protein